MLIWEVILLQILSEEELEFYRDSFYSSRAKALSFSRVEEEAIFFLEAFQKS
jgi:hypothetical protein